MKLLSSLCCLACLLASCNGPADNHKGGSAADDQRTQARFSRLIEMGNRAYAQKNSFNTFATSLRYYDSAQMIAERTEDTPLIADAIFAKGRVYDAWNKEPQKTIAYYQKAAELNKKIPGQYRNYLYLKHLVAHAYDKVKDSVNTTSVLRELYTEIALLPDTARRMLDFIPEMALIATEVSAYPLADSILAHLSNRAWIHNDSTTYDYLTHYYLTQTRLDAYWRRPARSYYLDSLRIATDTGPALMDRMYYANNLSALYAAQGNTALALKYLITANACIDSLNGRNDIGKLQDALVQSETLAERRKAEYAEMVRAARLRIIICLSVLLCVITVLSIYLYRRNKLFMAQSLRLEAMNGDLDDKVAQVELLNKEIHHRVKNNLHMIYSLLQMQERKTDDEAVIEQLQAARLRVESIASLHNQLLAGKGSLDFSQYIKSLISSVVACLSDEKKVVTHLETDAIAAPLNAYLAISLVLNEWVTNSVKYANVPDADVLEINVSIKHIGDEICVEYHDSGKPDVKPAAKASLGTEIVQLLCRQIGARFTQEPGNPYHYKLCMAYGA